MGATMMSSGAGAQRLGGQHLAVEAQRVAVDLGPTQHARRLVQAGHRRMRGAPDARQLGIGLAAPALDEQLVVGRELDALGAQAIGHCERKVGWHHGRGDPELPHGADVELAIDRLPGQSLGDELVAAELLTEQALELRRLPGDAVDLEHVGEDRPAAVGLQVEEGVADPERHLVAHLGGAQRVADDEQRGHQASLPTSERSTYCRIPPWRK
jgi:hypothetical protein